MRIGPKIAVPFTLLFVAALVTAAGVSISLISGALDERARDQVEHVSEMISQTDFALNPVILGKLERILGAEIVTYRRNGEVLVHTLDDPSGPGSSELLERVISPEAAQQIFEGGETGVVRDIEVRGTAYKVAYRPLRSPADTLVAIATPTAAVAATTRSLARSIGALAALIVALMALLSLAIARSITRPMGRLVAFTSEVAAGDLDRVAPVESRDEVGSLVRAFNDMVARLRDTESELLHSEKLALAGQLAARVAHDIRNPLSSIKMRAQMLRSRVRADEEARDALDALLREIDRVEWVVKGLLDLARPAELRLEKGDLNAVVEEALRSSEARFEHLEIRVEKSLAPALPSVRLDSERLHAALLNLLQNAVEAMPEGGRLGVSTRLADDPGGVHVEIRDEGSGILPEHRDRLFDPFFTTRRDGVGLGLMNTRSIVERHGGTLELRPLQPRGTSVVITLRAAEAGTDEA